MGTSGKQKADLRREIRGFLKGLPDKERLKMDRELAERALALLEIRNADMIYAYASLPWEAGTDEILRALLLSGKKVALPRVCGEEMSFFEISSMDDLKEGAYHIREPKESCVPANAKNAPVLVPGMAFTESGMRLGKGGGYYDRFLKKEPDHPTIALAYEFQIVEEIPAEPHDRGVYMIVTEAKVRKQNNI